jgi:hypothetical protein
MALSALLPFVGQFHKAIYRLPGVGEAAVRAVSRAAGTAAFRAPLLGGVAGHHIGHVRDGWLRFLGLVGLRPRVTHADDGAFEVEMDRCPYGFERSGDRDVCDACMDLDRTYVHHLKGRFEIVDRIPDGAACCRFRISYT